MTITLTEDEGNTPIDALPAEVLVRALIIRAIETNGFDKAFTSHELLDQLGTMIDMALVPNDPIPTGEEHGDCDCIVCCPLAWH